MHAVLLKLEELGLVGNWLPSVDDLGPELLAALTEVGIVQVIACEAVEAAHRAFHDAEPGSNEHDQAAVDFALAFSEIDVVRQKEAADESLHPRAQKVLATLAHEWEGLLRHAEFPELPLDNNAAEPALRNPVVMRKNCYGSGSRWATTLAARVWTITATASKVGVNPLSYLTCYLDACARAGGRAPQGEALEAFFSWAAADADLMRWHNAPPGPSPDAAPALLRARVHRRRARGRPPSRLDAANQAGDRRRCVRRARLAPARRAQEGHVGTRRAHRHGGRRARHAPRTANANGRIARYEPAPPELGFAFPETLSALGTVERVVVSTKPQSRRWRELVASYHYLGYTPLPARSCDTSSKAPLAPSGPWASRHPRGAARHAMPTSAGTRRRGEPACTLWSETPGS